MNSKYTRYLVEHCIDPDNLPNNIRVNESRNNIEIRIIDADGMYLFSKYRMFDSDVKYHYDHGSKMALFNSKSLKKSGTVYIVEGELDCMALSSLGYIAISSTGGCSSWKTEWTELLKDRNVRICFDNDTPGKKASVSLYKKLINKVGSLDIVLLPEKDICEHVYRTKGFTPQLVVGSDLYIYLTSPIKSKAQINRIQSYIETTVRDEVFRNELLDIVSDIYRSKYRPKVFTEGEKTSVEEVRKVPITNYIEFKNGVSCCVFHNERNPSMYYNDFSSAYPNTVKCYSCGKFGDVIDVVMAIENVGFKDALNLLKGN